MGHIDEKTKMAILRCLRDASGPVGSAQVARELEAYGLSPSARTIRGYFTEMEEEGLVERARRGRNGGRTITPRGTTEIDDSLISDRVGSTAAKVDMLSWEMDFDLSTRSGSVVLNLTLVPAASALRAARSMVAVLDAGLGMGEFVALFPPETQAGDVLIPSAQVGFGTICSITVNGILLNHRIPTVSRFGGVLEMRDRRPERFTDVIYYEGTSLDPLEIFIKAGLTRVTDVVAGRTGRIGASFREIPSAAVSEVEQVRQALQEAGLGGILMLGKRNQALLGFPVPDGRTGMIVTGGLNPASAIEEAGIPTTNRAFNALFDFDRLIHYADLERQVAEVANRSRTQ